MPGVEGDNLQHERVALHSGAGLGRRCSRDVLPSFHFRRAGLTRTKYVINERRHQGCDEGTVIGREEIEAIEIGRDRCMPSP